MSTCVLWHPQRRCCDFVGPTSGIEFSHVSVSGMNWGSCSAWMMSCFFWKWCIQPTEATLWRLNNASPRHWWVQACSLQLWGKYGADAAAGLPATSEVSICIPIAPYLHRMNTAKYQEPPALYMHLHCSNDARVVITLLHSDSRYLPGSRTAAAHHNAVNCLQSDQQMMARGLSSCCRVCRAALMHHSRRKHLPGPSITSRAHTHHLLLHIWVT